MKIHLLTIGIVIADCSYLWRDGICLHPSHNLSSLFILLANHHHFHNSTPTLINMSSIFLNAITPAFPAAGAGIKDKAKKQKAQQSQLTSAVNTINRLLSRIFISKDSHM